MAVGEVGEVEGEREGQIYERVVRLRISFLVGKWIRSAEEKYGGGSRGFLLEGVDEIGRAHV